MKLSDVDVKEVFEKLDIHDNYETQDFEIWEVTPLKKGMRIFYEMC